MQLDRNDVLRRNVLEIGKAAEQGAKLTTQLLAFSRKQVLTPQLVDLNHSIAQLQDMLQRLVGEDIELSTVLFERLGSTKVDPGQMEQVIMNLAVNARDAMPKGGKLTIETANVELDESYASTHAGVKPGRYVMLAIKDNGAGMDEATLSRIFEPFFTTKEEGKGTGLGLSTVYGIVQQSGGHIWVYSEIGYGTTFKIYFPRIDEDSENPAVPLPFTDVRGEGQIILLVDDNEPIRKSVGDFLEKKGYKVLQASNGKAAVEISRNYDGPIDVIVTDMVTPEMSGWELAEIIAAERPQIKVLLMSGYTDEGLKHHGLLKPDTAF
ncbi:MAG TPA: ATP-binding protein, partial [Acidobacteriota bacterium]|nr:ATP-binding protein [Acidobacteriota bacterium]